MYAKCVANLFGNPHFTVGKTYEIKQYGKTHTIETDYPECPLMCNLEKNMSVDKKHHISYGTLCEFDIINN